MVSKEGFFSSLCADCTRGFAAQIMENPICPLHSNGAKGIFFEHFAFLREKTLCENHRKNAV
jgi:hypothetical protein